MKSLPEFSPKLASRFVEEEIDGAALVLIRQEHLLNMFKLGPALKFYSRIESLKDTLLWGPVHLRSWPLKDTLRLLAELFHTAVDMHSLVSRCKSLIRFVLLFRYTRIVYGSVSYNFIKSRSWIYFQMIYLTLIIIATVEICWGIKDL